MYVGRDCFGSARPRTSLAIFEGLSRMSRYSYCRPFFADGEKESPKHEFPIRNRSSVKSR